MKIENEIIERYKFALCDEYYTYLDVIKHLNKTIPEFAENMGVYNTHDLKFDYPEFCKKFLIHLRKNIKKGKNVIDENIIYTIFEKMLLDKITKI